MTVVIEPRRSLAAAVMAGLAACAVGAMAVALVLDPIVPSYSKVPIAVVAVILIAGIGAVLLRLAAGRGGIVVDDATHRIGLGVTSLRDTWWLPLDACAGVRAAPMAAPGSSIERWLVVIEPRDPRAPAIVVAESDARELIDQVAAAVAQRSGLPLLDAESARAEAPPPVDAATSTTFAVARGAALQTILTLFGAALVTVGVVAFAGLEQDPILGFIFGPVLFVLGLTLLVIAGVKALAREDLAFDGRTFEHRFRLGPLRWGTRRVRARAPVWRIWLLGMRGGYLELRGDDGALVMAAGATTLSRHALADLARLPARFAAASDPQP